MSLVAIAKEFFSITAISLQPQACSDFEIGHYQLRSCPNFMFAELRKAAGRRAGAPRPSAGRTREPVHPGPLACCPGRSGQGAVLRRHCPAGAPAAAAVALRLFKALSQRLGVRVRVRGTGRIMMVPLDSSLSRIKSTARPGGRQPRAAPVPAAPPRLNHRDCHHHCHHNRNSGSDLQLFQQERKQRVVRQ